MLEHVGHEYMPGYFDTIHKVLKPGGRLVVQVERIFIIS
jgi:cyclopropane fatty-acyl-phospholipid synthase-like methyltransferase